MKIKVQCENENNIQSSYENNISCNRTWNGLNRFELLLNWFTVQFLKDPTWKGPNSQNRIIISKELQVTIEGISKISKSIMKPRMWWNAKLPIQGVRLWWNSKWLWICGHWVLIWWFGLRRLRRWCYIWWCWRCFPRDWRQDECCECFPSGS